MNRESSVTSAPASGVTDPRSRPLVALLRALTVLPGLITPDLSRPEPCGFGQYRSAATAHSCVHPGKRGRRAVIQHAIAVRWAIQSRRPIAGFRAEWALSPARLPSASSGRGSPRSNAPFGPHGSNRLFQRFPIDSQNLVRHHYFGCVHIKSSSI